MLLNVWWRSNVVECLVKEQCCWMSGEEQCCWISGKGTMLLNAGLWSNGAECLVKKQCWMSGERTMLLNAWWRAMLLYVGWRSKGRLFCYWTLSRFEEQRCLSLYRIKLQNSDKKKKVQSRTIPKAWEFYFSPCGEPRKWPEIIHYQVWTVKTVARDHTLGRTCEGPG
jgi:hypothetical protein